ncbi:MAG: PD-(D/E)XK nuclease family protein [Muribaculaceae bacterium]|nr:PD-(D/E)XK nuclease family protein [Muribaculaceae bacterium]
MAPQKNSAKGIIINRMYAGSYLSDNIGHEVINLFRADNNNFYIYINPYGSVSKEALNFENILLVRLAGKNLFEVIGLATGLTPAYCVTNPGNQTKKSFDDVLKAQNDYIKSQNGVSYGGVSIIDIFSSASLQDIYISFKADCVREPKEGQRIFLYYKEKKDKSYQSDQAEYSHLPGLVIEITQQSWPRTALKTYIVEDNNNNVPSDYDKLKDVIDNKSLWKEKSVEKIINDSLFKSYPNSLFYICGIQDNENCISNAIVYFMNEPRYKKLWVDFFKRELKINLSENYQAYREVDAKIKDDNDTGGRIDILIKDDDNIVVIENKIKSDINSIKSDLSDGSKNKKNQLHRYYNFINKKYINYKHYFFILHPNYNVPHLEGLNAKEYNKITYQLLYEYLNKDGIREIVEKDMDFNSLKILLKRHCNDTPNGYLRDEMMIKFYNRIKELK